MVKIIAELCQTHNGSRDIMTQMVEEAKEVAVLLGYNYQSGEWYERSYKVFNRSYKPKKIVKQKEDGLIIKTIKGLFE